MVAADLGRGGIALVLAAFPNHLGVVFAVAFGLSCFSVFFSPAANAVLTDLLGEDQIVGANSALVERHWPERQ